MMMTETLKKGKLRRSIDPPGYWLGEEFRDGFRDDPSLSEGYRRRIATWARAGGALSDAQRVLLEKRPGRAPSDAQLRAEALAGPQASPMWQYLTTEERGLVRDPATHPKLEGVSYPLGIGQLATLTGSTQDQIRHWHELGLLRARRSKGGHRQFFANAALRAFFLREQMSQPYITVLRDISKLKGAPLLAGMATLLQEQASSFGAAEHDLLTQTAHDLERVSAVFAGRSGATR
jgi:DNA-binding transcriptional MerR regulator